MIYGGQEFVLVNFDLIRIDPGILASRLVVRVRERCQRDHWQVSENRVLFDFSAKIETGHYRHHRVGDNAIDVLASRQEIPRLLAVGRLDNGMPHQSEETLYVVPKKMGIVNQQNRYRSRAAAVEHIFPRCRIRKAAEFSEFRNAMWNRIRIGFVLWFQFKRYLEIFGDVGETGLVLRRAT
jgi:hypothetical protein